MICPPLRRSPPSAPHSHCDLRQDTLHRSHLSTGPLGRDVHQIDDQGGLLQLLQSGLEGGNEGRGQFLNEPDGVRQQHLQPIGKFHLNDEAGQRLGPGDVDWMAGDQGRGDWARLWGGEGLHAV